MGAVLRFLGGDGRRLGLGGGLDSSNTMSPVDDGIPMRLSMCNLLSCKSSSRALLYASSCRSVVKLASSRSMGNGGSIGRGGKSRPEKSFVVGRQVCMGAGTWCILPRKSGIVVAVISVVSGLLRRC